MSFYTSLMFFRPQPPPRIRVCELAELLAQLNSVAHIKPDCITGVSIALGPTIDQDDLAASTWEDIAPGIQSVREIDYDIQFKAQTIEELIDPLITRKETVYRAHIHLGCACDPICKLFQRMNSPENSINLQLYDMSLEIGPIRDATLEDDASRHVGWIALTLSGQGYLFPWTRAEILSRAESSPELRSLAEICQRAWPIDPHTSFRSDGIRELLARTRSWISSSDVNTLKEWQWTVSESG